VGLGVRGEGVSFCGFRVSGSGFRVPGFEFRVSGSGFRVPGFGFRISGSGFRVPGSGFQVPGFGFRISVSGFRVPGFGFQVSGSGFRVQGVGRGTWAYTVVGVQLLRKNMKRFRGRLVFKAHRLVYHSTLGWKVIQKKKWAYIRGKGRRASCRCRTPRSA